MFPLLLKTTRRPACALTPGEAETWKDVSSSKKHHHPPKRRRVLAQRVLDLGQRPREVQCERCGIVFVQGNAQDERTHRLRCDADGVPCYTRKHVVDHGWLQVIALGPSPLLARVAKLAGRDLGGEADDDAHCRAYCAIVEKKIIGCALLDPQPENFDIVVAKLWVHVSHRRRGVATHLLDAVRSHFVFNYTIPKDRLGFTQPTQLGRAFFAAYLDADFPLANDNNGGSSAVETAA